MHSYFINIKIRITTPYTHFYFIGILYGVDDGFLAITKLLAAKQACIQIALKRSKYNK